MRPILTDQVAWSVGLSVTLVSPAKTAAPIERTNERSLLASEQNCQWQATSSGRGPSKLAAIKT